MKISWSGGRAVRLLRAEFLLSLCIMVEIGIKGREEAVYDDAGLVGQGTHERFIIDEKKFGDKVESKRHQ